MLPLSGLGHTPAGTFQPTQLSSGMQAPGGGATPDGAGVGNTWMASFDFLGAEELLGALAAPGDMAFLDPATLSAVCSADAQALQAASRLQHGASSSAMPACPQQQHKRHAPIDDSPENSDDDFDTRSKPSKRGKGEPSTDAARVKASKEKARRSKINDR